MLCLGANLHWRLAMAVPFSLSLPILAALYNLRESPAWLQRMGQMQEAQEAAVFYRLPPPEPSSKEEPLSQDIEEPKKQMVEQLKARLQQDSAFWPNLAFLAALNLLLGWSGFPILSFYAVEIFQLSGSPISASNTAFITRYINHNRFFYQNNLFRLFSKA